MYTSGLVCHVLNRAVGRAEIFSSAADYAMFEEQLAAACEAGPKRQFESAPVPDYSYGTRIRGSARLKSFVLRVTRMQPSWSAVARTMASRSRI